jgi:uncharacterized small protein (DUF1192 family)
MGNTNEVLSEKRVRSPMKTPTKKELYEKIARLEAELATLNSTYAGKKSSTSAPLNSYEDKYPPF